MPGVVVTTSVRTGPSGVGNDAAAQWFVAGTTERGPLDAPVLVRGVSEYKTYFGDYAPGNLYTYLQTYFEEGGSRAYVYRVTGANASAGFLDVADELAVDTLRFTAQSAGAWSDQVGVTIVAGDAANTFKVKVSLKSELLYTSRDFTSPTDCVNVMNTSPVAHLVVVTDLESVSSAPDNNAAVAVETALSTGFDGDTIAEGDYVAGLDMFSYELGTGAVSVPAQTGATLWAAIIAHAAANRRIALCAFEETDTASDAKGSITAMWSNANADYAGFYFPWIEIPDPVVSGLRLTQSPEAYVAAARSRSVVTSGPWIPGAGLVSEAKFVLDIVEGIDTATGNSLDEKRINAIRRIGNSIRVYGARSASADETNWRFLSNRDTVNFIVWGAEDRLEDFVFSTIDSRGALFARIESALVGLLDPIRIEGGLYEAFDVDGNPVDAGYSVEVSNENNPLQDLAVGKVAATINVRVSSIGDQITVTVTKSNLTTSVV